MISETFQELKNESCNESCEDNSNEIVSEKLINDINLNNEQINDDQSNDDAPEQVDFSSSRKIAQKIAQQQMNILNQLKKKEQEKRKFNQDRNIEQKKLKILKINSKKEQISSEEESLNEDKDNERETKTSQLKIILNDNDQVDKIHNRLIKKHCEINNRVISFKDRFICKNLNIKRVNSSQVKLMMHKRKIK